MNILFWNIEGLKGKLENRNVIDYLNCFDLLCLVETWTGLGEIPELLGFECICRGGMREADRGRYPGGIAVFYQSKMTRQVTEIRSSMKEIIWTLVVYERKQILIRTIYLQPESSRCTHPAAPLDQNQASAT